MYPHWIYECRIPAQTVGIERHVAFFDASRDVQRYARLKTGLALYRLVFGQANQEHLLGDLEDRLATLGPQDRKAAQRRLSGYMLNLSPFGSAEAMRLANTEAHQLLEAKDASGLDQLIADVRRIMTDHEQELAPATAPIEVLVSRVQAAMSSGDLRSHRVRKAVTALAYLRNPYDEFFDEQSVGGFDDDIEVLTKAV